MFLDAIEFIFFSFNRSSSIPSNAPIFQASSWMHRWSWFTSTYRLRYCCTRQRSGHGRLSEIEVIRPVGASQYPVYSGSLLVSRSQTSLCHDRLHAALYEISTRPHPTFGAPQLRYQHQSPNPQPPPQSSSSPNLPTRSSPSSTRH